MTTTPRRLVLEGVPQVGFYESGSRCPEDIPLPSVLRAIKDTRAADHIERALAKT
jgi:hypothetical protein